jgi:hypothetical protein
MKSSSHQDKKNYYGAPWFRFLVNLMTLIESKNTAKINTQEIQKLEQYNIPISDIIEELSDPETSSRIKERIKITLSAILEDGGLWGETFNAHDHSNTVLKQKLIALRDSI